MKKLILIFVFIVISSESYSQDTNTENNDLLNLFTQMQGSFSSEEQSKNDSDYFDIRLHMARIWSDRTDGYWLYVEQAVAQAQEKPYRQRVYHVTQKGDGTFESAVFTMNAPLRFAGEWKKDNPMENFSVDSLIAREGCTVHLKKTSENVYEGSTQAKDCESDLRGAKYAVSEVKITSEGIVSWDRGYNDKDEQVWGAEKGGYNFIKLNK
ncbi:MAG TPA: chromophore lyase CpcT/CpeT [Ignavibacteria bacterium]|nr:chromophore lyase CpcT/CpeT [Ignavibacteria bacterium]